MANLTVDEAVTKIRQFLDDTSGMPRWSAAQITDALTDCVSACVVRYAREGGDRFDLETTATTSALTGSISISSVAPALVKQISVVEGGIASKLSPMAPMRSGLADLTARDLRILYVREYALSSTGTHPLIGVGVTEANSWRAFDKWVCLEAALQLSMKNADPQRIALMQAMTDKARADALERSSTPMSYETPRPSTRYGINLHGVRWQYVQPSTVHLIRDYY